MFLKDLLVEDYSLVFRDSVLLLNGIPYYILSFKGKVAECLNIGSQDYEFISFDKLKSLEMPHAGFLNHRSVSVYLERTPCRRYKHGFNRENIRIIHSGILEQDDYSSSIVRDALETGQQLRSKTLYNTFMNIYPSLENAVEMLEDDKLCVAFDRQFAILFSKQILYKDKVVGCYADGKIILDKKFNHLKIALPKGLQ